MGALTDVLSDVRDSIDDTEELSSSAKDFKKSAGKFKKSSKSVIKAAKGNIFEFPVFVANSVPLDYATATVALLEQVYASYLQMAISINPIIDDETARKGAQFDHLRSDVNKYLECVDPTDMPYAYDACHAVYNENGITCEFNLVNIEDATAKIINEAMDHEPLSEFDHFFSETYSGDGAGFFEGCEWIQEADPVDPNNNRPKYNPRDLGEEQMREWYKSIPKSLGFQSVDQWIDYCQNDLQIDAVELGNTLLGNKPADDANESIKKYYEAMEAKRQAEAMSNQNSEEYKAAKAKAKQTAQEWADYFVNRNLSRNLTKEQIRKARADADRAEYERDDYQANANRDKQLKLAQIRQTRAAAEKTENENRWSKEDREQLKEKLANDVETSKWSKEKTEAEAKKAQKDLENYDEDRELKNEKTKAETEKSKAEIEKLKRQGKWDEEDRELDKAKKLNDARVKTPQFLDESKIQKLNTMKPLMMSVDLNVVDKNGSLSRPVSYVIGVKCHTRLIESSILPEVAAYPLKEMNKQLRKIKWRSGELKFGRDLLWKVKSKKQTASDARDKKRKWYRRLYELSHMSGDGVAAASIKNGKSPWANWWQDKLTGGNNKDVGHGLIPNATIIMSKSDVDNIKREKDIDLLSGSKAAKMCKELFLIGMVVIDEDAESVKVLFPDLHNDYDVMSIAAVKKQLAQLDTAGTKTRDIMKLLG